MVLSNAERQARYRQRLKEAAASGVTPEQMLEALKLNWSLIVGQQPDLPDWEAVMAECRNKKAARGRWIIQLQDSIISSEDARETELPLSEQEGALLDRAKAVFDVLLRPWDFDAKQDG